jgi:hypothetical protein
MQFVLVSKERASDRQFFERTAKTLCPTNQVCQVMFWTERKHVPSRTPFTDTQLNQLAAQYNQNPNTGYVRSCPAALTQIPSAALGSPPDCVPEVAT